MQLGRAVLPLEKTGAEHCTLASAQQSDSLVSGDSQVIGRGSENIGRGSLVIGELTMSYKYVLRGSRITQSDRPKSW